MHKLLTNTLLTATVVAAAMLPMQTQAAALAQKSVFAYDVRVNHTTPSTPQVSYKLNAQASKVTVDIYVGTTKVASKTGGTAQSNTVTFSNVYGVGKVTAKVTAYTKTSAGPCVIPETPDGNAVPASNGVLRFVAPFTIGINNCTDSPTFGTILVGEGNAGADNVANYYSTCSSSRGINMLYAFDPQMQGYKNPQAQNLYGFNANINPATSSTCTRVWARVRYSEDGRLFAMNSMINGGGLYELKANSIVNLNAQGTRVFQGTQLTDWGEWFNNGVLTGAAGAGLAVWGKGADLKLATLTSNKDVDNQGNCCSVMYYALGTRTTVTGSPQAMLDGRNGGNDIANMVHPQDCHITFGKDGQGLLATCVGDNTATSVSAVNMDLAMNINYRDHEAGDKIFTSSCACAYNKDYSLLAVGTIDGEWGYGKINLYRTSWWGNGNQPTLTYIGCFAPHDKNVLGSVPRDIAWDYANNLYVVCDQSHSVIGIQLPSHVAGASQTTPAPADQTYDLNNPNPQGEGSLTGLKAYIYKNGTMTQSFAIEAADSMVLTDNKTVVNFFRHLAKEPTLTVAAADIDSISFIPPAKTADMLSISFGPLGQITDGASAANQPYWASGNNVRWDGKPAITAPMTYYNTDLHRYVAHFDNKDGVPQNYVMGVDYTNNATFKNKLADGHTLEAFVTFENAYNESREFNALSSQQGGGTALMVNSNHELGMETATAGAYKWAGSGMVATKTYTHWVGVYDKAAGKLNIYINGQLQGTVAATGDFTFPVDATCHKFTVGADINPGSAGAGWNGEIAFARIYDETLTATDVDQLYQRAMQMTSSAVRMVTGITYAKSANVSVGGSFAITGTGFKAGDQIALVAGDADLPSKLMLTTAISGNTATVTVPANITGGKRYVLYLVRDDELQSLGLVKFNITNTVDQTNAGNPTPYGLRLYFNSDFKAGEIVEYGVYSTMLGLDRPESMMVAHKLGTTLPGGSFSFDVDFLHPNRQYRVRPYFVSSSGKRYVGKNTDLTTADGVDFDTEDWIIETNQVRVPVVNCGTSTPTNMTLKFGPNASSLTTYSFSAGNNGTFYSPVISGLTPNTTYVAQLTYTMNGQTYTRTKDVRTWTDYTQYAIDWTQKPVKHEVQWAAQNTLRGLSPVGKQVEYPRMCRVNATTLILTYHGSENQDGWWDNSYISRSTDNGSTWSTPERMFSAYANFFGSGFWRVVDPQVTLLSNGWLLYSVTASANPETNYNCKCMTSISKDGGLTWSDPIVVGRGRSWEPHVVELKNGDLELLVSSEAAWWEPRASYLAQEIVSARSTDHGQTWTKYERASYLNNARDGMPVPVVMQGNRGVMFTIESVNSSRRPSVVHRYLADKWETTPWDGIDDLNRFASPMAGYGGAPYMIQLPTGETLMMAHNNATGSEWRTSRPEIWVCDNLGQNGKYKTQPLSGTSVLPNGTGAYYNSFFQYDANTVWLLVTKAQYSGSTRQNSQIMMLKGTIVAK